MRDKFEMFIELLIGGERVNINPYEYGDFLRYVEGSEYESLFEKHMSREFKMISEDEGVVTVWLNHPTLA